VSEYDVCQVVKFFIYFVLKSYNVSGYVAGLSCHMTIVKLVFNLVFYFKFFVQFSTSIF